MQPEFITSLTLDDRHRMALFTEPEISDEFHRLFIIWQREDDLEYLVGYGMIVITDDDASLDVGCETLAGCFAVWPSEMTDPSYVALPPLEPRIIIEYENPLYVNFETGEMDDRHTFTFGLTHDSEPPGYTSSHLLDVTSNEVRSFALN